MTTGSAISDLLFPINSPPDRCGNETEYWRQRVWNGTDEVKTPPVYVTERIPGTNKYRRRKLRLKRKREPNSYHVELFFNHKPLNICIRASNVTTCSGLYVWGSARNCYNTGVTFGTDPFDANSHNELLAKVREQIAGSSFDPGVFLAEGHKSLAMVSDGAKKIAKSFYLAKHGDYSRAWKALGQSPKRVPKGTNSSAANIWAEYRWGWTPLMQDMHDGAQFVSHMLHAPAVFTVRARRVKKVSKKPGSYWGYTCADGHYLHGRQLIGYLQEPVNPALNFWNVLDPASIAWELVPYSFVVDWFVPIGTYLNARGISSQLVAKWVTTDFVQKLAYGRRFSSACGAERDITGPLGPTDMRYDLITVDRTISSGVPSQKPVFRGFGTVATWKHAVDSVALLVQRLKKG